MYLQLHQLSKHTDHIYEQAQILFSCHEQPHQAVSHHRELRCAGRLQRHKVWRDIREFQINQMPITYTYQTKEFTEKEFKTCKATQY